MIYVMSDIHGQYNAYLNMLDTIRFSEQDTLYILGDVLDRGEHGIPLLMDIMERDNVMLLRGNHEQILMDRYSYAPVVPIHPLYWRHELGGKSTERMFRALKSEQRKAVLAYLNATPLQLQVKVGEWTYHLVHGYPDADGDIERILWDRMEFEADPLPLPPGANCIVFGHTPTEYYTGKDGGLLNIYFDDCAPIIDVDCGCALQGKPGRLGCLCLDNRKEFYIDIW